MRRFLGALIAVGVVSISMLVLPAHAAERREPAPFRGADRWVVIGDSITHGRRYHSFVYLFYATRYPGARFSTHNCGISGDSASGAVSRYPWDIGVHEPTVATIMLGMNDVGRGSYGKDKTGAAIEKRREQAIASHVANMDRLAGLLSAAGARIIFLTPSIYDQTGDLSAHNCYGVNDALGECGRRVGELADKYGAAVIDLHGPMTELNAQLQKSDAKQTLVGPDRVHPGDPGQFVMAYLILKQQGVSGVVAQMEVDADGGSVINAENCTISDVSTDSTGVRFSVLERALPYPVMESAVPALAVVPFMAELNRETLRVKGLPPGRHILLIDSIACTEATAQEFAEGVELAGNQRTPMYTQALQVLALNQKRHSIVGSKLRTLASQRHGLCRRNKELDPNDFAAMKAVLLAELESKKGSSNYGYFKGQAERYIQCKPKEAELWQQVAATTDEMWQVNQPKKHTFEIVPARAELSVLLSELMVDDFSVYSGLKYTSWTDCAPAIQTE